MSFFNFFNPVNWFNKLFSKLFANPAPVVIEEDDSQDPTDSDDETDAE
jgi:hypothetical protein